MKNNTVSIIGLGYVGLPILATISEKTKVIGYDINKSLISNLKKQKFNFTEPGLSKILRDSFKKNKIFLSNKLQPSDIYYIAVPTPVLKNFKVDLAHIIDVIEKISKLIKENDLIILTSTVPVGTTKKIYDLLRKKTKNHIKFFMSFTPETILPGNALYELKNNSKIIGGINFESSNLTKLFINKFIAKNTVITDDKTAEIVKLAQNSYRDLNIAFANELEEFATKECINFSNLVKLSNKHPRVNIHHASIGVGGHCIPVDPYFLISKNNNYFSLIKQSRKINNKKTDYISEEIKKHIIKNKINSLCFFGLTYKENVDDFRNSPALKILKKIKKQFPKKNINFVEPYLNNKEKLKINCNMIKLKDIKTILHNELFIFLVGHNIFKDYLDDIKSKNLKILNYTNMH